MSVQEDTSLPTNRLGTWANAMPDAFFPGTESKIDKEKLRIVELAKVNSYNLDNDLLTPYFQEIEEEQERPTPPTTSFESGKIQHLLPLSRRLR